MCHVSFLCFNIGENFSVIVFPISTGNNWKGLCTPLSVGCFDKSPNTKTPTLAHHGGQLI